MSGAGCLVGNLDAEAELARAAAPRERSARELPEALQRQLAAAALLMRAFARDGDLLWTARPVSAERMPYVAELPSPALVTGAVPRDVPLLSWCPVPSLPRAGASGASDGGNDDPGGAPLHERLWRLPRSAADVAARVAHRGFALATARALGLERPGVRLVHDLDELLAHLAAGGADTAPGQAWVLKPPYSAAGRGHVLGRGAGVDDGALRRRIERLLASTGVLLFEPWLERVDDWGVCGLVTVGGVTPAGVELLGVHRLLVDERGGFRGVAVLPDDDPLPELGADGLARLRDTAQAVGQALAAAGHRGPFGVDAFRARRADGRLELVALGEINPRLTFGLVARVLAERLAPRLRAGPGERPVLRFARSTACPPAPAVCLLSAGDADGLGAWLELERAPRR